MARLPDPWRSLSSELGKIVRRIEGLERRVLFTGTLADVNGGDLVRADPAGGAAWPLAPVPFAGLSWPTWDSNDTATFASVAMGFSLKSSPQLVVTARAICDGSAAGEVRFVCNGVVLGTASVPNLSMTTVTFGPYTPAGAIGSDLNVQVDTRVTSGAGKCYARVISAQQWPST